MPLWEIFFSGLVTAVLNEGCDLTVTAGISCTSLFSLSDYPTIRRNLSEFPTFPNLIQLWRAGRYSSSQDRLQFSH
jgi:hypothetical protein